MGGDEGKEDLRDFDVSRCRRGECDRDGLESRTTDRLQSRLYFHTLMNSTRASTRPRSSRSRIDIPRVDVGFAFVSWLTRRPRLFKPSTTLYPTKDEAQVPKTRDFPSLRRSNS